MEAAAAGGDLHILVGVLEDLQGTQHRVQRAVEAAADAGGLHVVTCHCCGGGLQPRAAAGGILRITVGRSRAGKVFTGQNLPRCDANIAAPVPVRSGSACGCLQPCTEVQVVTSTLVPLRRLTRPQTRAPLPA